MADDIQGLIFSIRADEANTSEVFQESRSNLNIRAPPSVPEDGALAWELLEGCTCGVEILHPHLILPQVYSVALWFKPAPKSDRTPFASVVHAGLNALLTTDPASDSFSARWADSTETFCFEAQPHDGWQFLVLTVQSALLGRANTGTTTCHIAKDPCFGVQAAGKVSVGFSGGPFTGIGRSGACIGWVSELHLWDRVLDASEMNSLWEASYERHGIIIPPPSLTLAPETWRLAGRVVTTSGAPAADVGISLKLTSGVVQCSSNTQGLFQLHLPLESRDSAKASPMYLCKVGFAACTTIVDHSLSWVEATILQVSVCQKVNMLKGGVVQDPDTGLVLTVPAGAFVRADGTTFEADATISLSVIDPDDPLSLSAMPGNFRGTSLEGCEVHIASFGALWIDVNEADNLNSKLQIDEKSGGLTAEWSNQVPVNSFDRGGEFPTSWSFDTTSGLWIQETHAIVANGLSLPIHKPSSLETNQARSQSKQTARKPGKKGKAAGLQHVNDAMVDRIMARFREGGTNSYKLTKIDKKGWWNCDCIFAHTILSGVVLRQGEVVQDTKLIHIQRTTTTRTEGTLQVVGSGQDYRGRSFTLASYEDGRFNLVVQPLSIVSITIQYPEQESMQSQVPSTLKEKSFGPFKSGDEAAVVDVGILELFGE